ncbi:neutral/alkaline non-lysosomal ceramidase N-terminal domain-containing protein [Blastopirellula marina]|uniref:Dehydrogenase n=1 Tax=Blastopirellula marina TaxID=124 RepID=A0A2S8G2K5_9BACT|nr:neutral/alkaline non-lysosomal ceramidase N-terminal domain-containing protein [Blastopirellula marina]PQO38491.1 dehydrogenase [Blastopirellula marina]PTL45148.1 dehydrogenase [Blastopirellula marina]
MMIASARHVLKIVFFCAASVMLVANSPPLFAAETDQAKSEFHQSPSDHDTLRQIGAASLEITPQHPILMSGYAARDHQLQLNVRHRLWAHALAISDEQSEPALLITVDNVGVPAKVRTLVAKSLAEKYAVPPERVTISSTHTHGGPMLTGVLENLLTREMTPVERQAVDGYTNTLTQKLIEVASQALAARHPGYLFQGRGEVDFAINRRNETVVDHAMPLLVAVDKQGKPFAVTANYACHCVSASNGMLLTGDWAGCAVAELEQQLPGVVSLVTIGCGGDQNPADKGGVEASERQGKQLADEVIRVLKTKLQPINGPLQIAFDEVRLPFDTLPTEAEWQERSSVKGIDGYHAKVNLARIQNGQPLPESLVYPVQTWKFGNDLTMVFLGDEVVVDYTLLLKNKYGERTWVSAYSNDVTCYIPSERVLRRGGYEGRTSMLWYDKPSPFAPGLEKIILGEVDRQLTSLASAKQHEGTGGVAPRSPEDSIKTMQVDRRFQIEVVAAEPLVIDPVAIDFGPDGKLWVVEMHDYPLGIDDHPSGGGRVKYLEDTDHDGTFDQATLFLDGLPFPTGVKAWKKGVLICAAPDVLYAEDTNNDGQADETRVVLSGFATHNYQARVNGLSLGLDNWLYGAGGIFGGKLTSEGHAEVDAENRDFRFQPDTGIVEAVSGRTQQGRARDDWGNWFGCTNSNLLYYYPSQERYFERNPLASAPNPVVSLSPGQTLFPLGNLVQFAKSGAKGVPTSVCGLDIYRDDRLGETFFNNAMVCEPVNQLVHRRVVSQAGGQVTSERAPEEQQREFLASTDNWFRPVQVRTAPDGTIWVVDMYRYLIEHPKFLSDQVKAQLDIRAGDDRGRIYRILPKGQAPQPLPNLRELTTEALAVALDHSNGTLRDMVHAELLFRGGNQAQGTLEKLVREATLPQVRLQALCVLDGLGLLDLPTLQIALADAHPAVRSRSVLLAEKLLKSQPQCERLIIRATQDLDHEVRLQAAFSLGACVSPEAAKCLAEQIVNLAQSNSIGQALRTSLNATNVPQVLAAVKALPIDARDKSGVLLVAIAQMGNEATAGEALKLSLTSDGDLTITSKIVEVLKQRKLSLPTIASEDGIVDRIIATVTNGQANVEQRIAAIHLLPTLANRQESNDRLRELLSPQEPNAVQAAALAEMVRSNSPAAQGAVLDQWLSFSPQLQATALEEFLARPESTLLLLKRLEENHLPRSAIDLANRQRLLDHPNSAVHKLASHLFAGVSNSSLQHQIDQLRETDLSGGNAAAGRTIFQNQCAACHRYAELGKTVGPDLQSLTDRTKDFLVTAILDPNAAVDQRYATYSVLLEDGRVLGGILAEESNQAITLKEKEGIERRVLRAEIEQIQGSGKSLMPEGLGQVLPPEAMKDLLAFLGAVKLEAATTTPVTKTFESVTALQAGRQAIAGGKEEYAEIPSLFHVALAVGHRNDTGEILAVLQACLPNAEEPLSDWQTVVLGAVVKGISEEGVWPQQHVARLLQADVALENRWNRMLELALVKANDNSVRHGTRYDALRLIAMLPWSKSKQTLEKYTASGQNAELVRGAIEGLGDVPNAEAAAALNDAIPRTPEQLRVFAMNGLLRADGQRLYLLDAISSGLISPEAVSGKLRTDLFAHPEPSIRQQAESLLIRNNR